MGTIPAPPDGQRTGPSYAIAPGVVAGTQSSRIAGAVDATATDARPNRSGTNAMLHSESTSGRLRGLCLTTSLLGPLIVTPPTIADDATARTIHAQITEIKGDDGRIACAFFQSGDGFPITPPGSQAMIVTAPIRDGDARCVFRDVPPGTYAIAAIHDENRNGDLDRDWLGIPTEGYGFSENARASLGAPSFKVASFPFDGGELFLTIRLQY